MTDQQVGFGKTGKVAAAKAYQQSFGPMQEETRYYDPTGGMQGKSADMREDLKDRLEMGMKSAAAKNGANTKALTTESGGAGTAGSALVPVYVDPRIIDRSRKYTPWTEMIPRVTNRGMTADYNVIESKGDATFAAEGAALGEQDDEQDRESEPIKFLYAKGKVTGPSQAAQPAYMVEGFESQGSGLQGSSFTDQQAQNAKQYQVLKRARAFREREEDAIWNGDSASNSLEFDGVIAQQGTTNQKDVSGSSLSYDHTEDAMELAADSGGRPNVAGANFNVIKQLRQIMIDLFNYRPADMDQGEMPFGVPSSITLETQIGPVPVIPSQFMTGTDGDQQLFFLDMDQVEMRNLLDMSYEDKPDEDDSQVFLLKAYETLVMRAPDFNAFVDNIAKA